MLRLSTACTCLLGSFDRWALRNANAMKYSSLFVIKQPPITILEKLCAKQNVQRQGGLVSVLPPATHAQF